MSSKSSGGAWLMGAVLAVAAVAVYKNPDAVDKLTQGNAAPAASAADAGKLDIPAEYLALYRSSPKCDGLHWSVLAAVGKIETNHGRAKLPGVRSGANYAGAKGPMQFLQPTWDGVRKRHPDLGPNVYDPRNAIPGAAHKLCDDGARAGQLRRAIFSYNHSTEYVNDVLAQAKVYSS